MADPTTAASAAPAPGAPRGGYMASTAKHGLIYLLGNVLARMAGFIMLPVYTRLLTTDDYGVMEILALSGDILGMLAGLGIRRAVVRLYYQYDAIEDRNAVVSTASLLLIGIFGVITTLGVIFAAPISDALLGPDQPAIYVRLAVFSFVLGALGDVPGVWLQALQRSATLVTANFTRLVLSLALNILFVVVLRIGVSGIFLSTIISTAVVGGYMAWRMFRTTGVRFDGHKARELVAFGAPLVASNLGSFVLHFSDRYFLRYFHTLATVGIYALSYKFALLIAMFVEGPFNNIWTAKALEIHNREGDHAPPILRSILVQYSIVVATAALGIALFSTDVVHWVLGPEFRAADQPVPVLALGIAFFCLRNTSQTGAMIAKRPGHIAWVTSGAAVLAIALNLLLIPRWAGMGAAAATAGAFGAEFFVMRRLSERVYPMGLTVADALGPLGLAAVTWLTAFAVVPTSAHPLVGTGIRVASLGLFALLLTGTGYLPATSWRLLAKSVRDPKALVKALKAA